jgi:hypothetical protein
LKPYYVDQILAAFRQQIAPLEMLEPHNTIKLAQKCRVNSRMKENLRARAPKSC